MPTTTPKRWTIYGIKYALPEDNHFFDRKTLKFFGQTMRSFSVQHHDGRVFISATIKHGGITQREFIPPSGSYTTNDYTPGKLISLGEPS